MFGTPTSRTNDCWFGLIDVAVLIGAAWGAAFVARNGQVDTARTALAKAGLLSIA